MTTQTESERYVEQLCARTFLRLWSYPNPYRDQGRTGGKGHGKELCDLLVICGNTAVLFSVKECQFRPSDNVGIDWTRWYRRAVDASARQVIGGERFLRSFSDRVYINNECSIPLPITLDDPNAAKIHRVVVALGIKRACIEHYRGGSGSLVLCPTLESLDRTKFGGEGVMPFAIGHIHADKFVHVLDDTSLDVVLGELDTITDFVNYLDAKERLMRSGSLIYAAGEEELLAYYIRRVDENQQHDFVIPHDVAGILLEEGQWEATIRDGQYHAKRRADHISYLWDEIIGRFSKHLLEGTLLPDGETDLARVEGGLRILALEDRLARRVLAESLANLVDKAPKGQIASRTVISDTSPDLAYVFQAFPTDHDKRQNYRAYRRSYLSDYCLVVAREMNRRRVVGIATEAGIDRPERSEDLVLIEIDEWTDKMKAEALEAKVRWNIRDPKRIRTTPIHATEYPEPANSTASVTTPTQRSVHAKRIGRNDPCPCGSGRKYKRCCLFH